jgi:hypothetical protein
MGHEFRDQDVRVCISIKVAVAISYVLIADLRNRTSIN